MFSVVNNSFFVNVDVVLFINKKDVLREKLKHTPFNVGLRDWPASKDPRKYEDCMAFLSAKVWRSMIILIFVFNFFSAV